MRWDCHNDTALFLREEETLASLPQAHLDWERFCQHLDGAFFAIFLDEKRYADHLSETFRQLLSSLVRDIDRQPRIRPLLYQEQLDHWRAGEHLALISMEGAAPLGADGRYLDEFFRAGLRAIGLTWNYTNAYAGSAMEGGGLTRRGRDLIYRCNDLGLLVDVAHASPRTLDDVLAWSKKPIIDSHTVCAALCGRFPRAIADSQLRDLAAAGGVAGIAFVPEFLGGDGGLDQLCSHIEHGVEVAGSCHIALGADYDGTAMDPSYAGVERRPLVLERLAGRGMNDEDLANIAGGSVVRLLRQVLPAEN